MCITKIDYGSLINNVHSVCYKRGNTDSISFFFYKDAKYLVIMQLLECYKKLDINNEIIAVINSDPVFSLLSESCKDVLCKLLFEFCYSVYNDKNEISLAVHFTQQMHILAFTRIRNELNNLVQYAFGSDFIDVSFNESTNEWYDNSTHKVLDLNKMINIRSIIIYGDYDESNISYCNNYASDMTFPRSSKIYSVQDVFQLLKRCYEKNIPDFSGLVSSINAFAITRGIDSQSLISAVVSYIIRCIIRASEAGKLSSDFSKASFKAQLKFVITQGVLQ